MLLTLNGWRTRFIRSATPGMRERVTDAQSGQSVGLGKCAREITRFGNSLQPSDAVALSSGQIFVVGLVQHHQHVGRQLRRKPRVQPGRTSVPVGLFGLAMKTRRVSALTARTHRVEVVAEIARRHFDAGGPDRLHRERIDGECMLRINRLACPASETRAPRGPARRWNRCRARCSPCATP